MVGDDMLKKLLIIIMLLVFHPHTLVGEYYEVPAEIIDKPVDPPKVIQPPRYREVEATITAYNENDGQTPGKVMANGEKVHDGALANDVLPFGTKVLIDNEEFVVKDRFGAGHPVERFDRYVVSRGAAVRHGVRKVTVQIKEEE